MLIQFKATNSASFKDEAVFCMTKSAHSGYENSNVIETTHKRLKILKSAGIYGPNASGKSNLLWSFARMQGIITKSFAKSPNAQIPVISFKLNTLTENMPSRYEAVFILNDNIYRYGFEATTEEVVGEWLYGVTNKKEINYFNRVGQNIVTTTHFKEGDKYLQKKTRPNTLFISTVAQFNGEIATRVVNWFNSIMICPMGPHEYRKTLRTAATAEGKKDLLQFLKAADIGIEDIIVKTEKVNFSTNEDGFVHNQYYDFRMVHRKYNKNQKQVGAEAFPAHYESLGTSRLLGLFGYVQDALKKGKIIIIDELERSLHSHLVDFLIKQFNSPENKHAQLIFATHDLNTLSSKSFRRDQIWFTEKDQFGASQLFSLCEFKGIRKNENLIRDYNLGKFKAIPNIDKIYKFNYKKI